MSKRRKRTGVQPVGQKRRRGRPRKEVVVDAEAATEANTGK